MTLSPMNINTMYTRMRNATPTHLHVTFSESSSCVHARSYADAIEMLLKQRSVVFIASCLELSSRGVRAHSGYCSLYLSHSGRICPVACMNVGRQFQCLHGAQETKQLSTADGCVRTCARLKVDKNSFTHNPFLFPSSKRTCTFQPSTQKASARGNPAPRSRWL